MGYINKVRQRAGATLLTGSASVRTVLDERGRELCGEYCRFYDLKRTGMFKDNSYLQATHQTWLGISNQSMLFVQFQQPLQMVLIMALNTRILVINFF